jgi:NAD(P)-dependent dehydrogenase (short-subunit alcohol dehydrogenase family)
MNVNNKVCVITGGAGMLGEQFAVALLEAGGIVYILDINESLVKMKAEELNKLYGPKCFGIVADITNERSISDACSFILQRSHSVDVLINNAANNPKVEKNETINFSQLGYFPLEQWNKDIAVGLTGAFVCSKIFGTEMEKRNYGVIINISSDLGIIAPDQRLYEIEGLSENQQPKKPVSYSVVKHGLIGLTKYLATYWANKGIRVNSLCPGGVFVDQPDDFVQKISKLIPMGRMAIKSEYQKAIVFLASNASSYMTGQNLIIDGGRSCW